MTRKINDYVSITVKIQMGDYIPNMNKGYATLFDHTTNRVIRTIRGKYILKDTSADVFCDRLITDSLADLINRYTVLANAYENSNDAEKSIIDSWLDNDPQFNDSKYHGDK